MDVLQRITELREAKGWSLNMLATKTGVPQSTLSNAYSRGTQPSIETLSAICTGLGITLAEFFAGADDKPLDALPSGVQVRKANPVAERLCDLIYSLSEEQLALLEALIQQMKK